MKVTKSTIVNFIREHSLSGQIVCIHCSMRSLGILQGGPASIVDAFLSESCTIMVPAHSWYFIFLGDPVIRFNESPQINFSEKAWRFDDPVNTSSEKYFYPDSKIIDDDMGALSRYVVEHPERVRSNNPLGSFAAIGPHAKALMNNTRFFYHPLERLVELKGKILLIGVGVHKMTLIHMAKEKAGHRMLYRWVLDANNQPRWVAGGGCSSGFIKLKPLLDPITKETSIGLSPCKLFNATEVIAALSDTLTKTKPNYPVCENPDCTLCEEAEVSPDSDDNNYYLIEHGDNLFDIAARFDIPYEKLIALYKNPTRIAAGSFLKWPQLAEQYNLD